MSKKHPTKKKSPPKKLSATQAKFAGLSLPEKRKKLRAEADPMKKRALFSLLDETEKETVRNDLKKSIAKMMVFWVAHSRHDLHDDLLAGKPDGAWAGLALKEAFGSDREWKKFFRTAHRVFNDVVETEVETAGGKKIKGKLKVVEEGAKRISKRVHGEDGMTNSPDLLPPDWEPSLDPFCPGDATLDVMYRAAAAFVDSHHL